MTWRFEVAIGTGAATEWAEHAGGAISVETDASERRPYLDHGIPVNATLRLNGSVEPRITQTGTDYSEENR
jgi:hypothetical protein